MPAEGRSPGSRQRTKWRRTGDWTMVLEPPTSVQKLQTALQAKAKGEPDYRFYLLYDKVYRADVLGYAYRRCKANQGAPGVDGQDFADIEAYGEELWLGELADTLRRRTYRPEAVRRVWIPKKGSKEMRPLGIPRIADRVVMRAAMVVLEPIFDVDLPAEQHGYRAQFSAHTAVKEVSRLINAGHTQVIEADLAAYFGSIPHSELLKSVARRVSDRHLLHLIKMWLVAPVDEDDGKGGWKRTTKNKDRGRGVPQGAPATPLTQKITCAAARRRVVGSWRCFVSRGSRGYRDRVADDDGVVTDENLFDEQSDNTLTLDNVQRLRRGTQSRHERRQCFGQAQIRGAIICLVGERGQLRLQGLFAPAQPRHAGAQFIEREQGFLIGRHQPFHALAGTRQIALQGFLAPFVWTGSARSIQAPLDFRLDETGVFDELENLVPYQLIEQILAHGPVVAERATQTPIGIRPQTAVVVDFPGTRACGSPVHGLAALAAADNALQDARLDRTAGREAFVVLQPLLRKIERGAVDNDRHGDFDPFLARPLMMGAVARDTAAAQAYRPCDTLAQRRLGLAETSQSVVCRIAQHGPDGGAFPTRDALARRDLLFVEAASDGANAQALGGVPVIDVAHHEGDRKSV